MNGLYVILIMLLLNGCQAPSESAVTSDNSDLMHQGHIINMMNQVKNDLRIFNSVNTKYEFRIDDVEVDKQVFLNQDRERLIHVAHRTIETIYLNDGSTDQFKIQFLAYSQDYLAEYKFTPEYFNLFFNDEGLLSVSVNHSVNGSLTAYGYDKSSGSKMVEYHSSTFVDSFMDAQKISNRHAEAMRLILMINDSMYVHDYTLPKIRLHDH